MKKGISGAVMSKTTPESKSMGKTKIRMLMGNKCSDDQLRKILAEISIQGFDALTAAVVSSPVRSARV